MDREIDGEAEFQNSSNVVYLVSTNRMILLRPSCTLRKGKLTTISTGLKSNLLRAGLYQKCPDQSVTRAGLYPKCLAL